jgi:hypothetical protein
MSISKILSDSPPIDRFSSAGNIESSAPHHDCRKPAFRRKNSPTAEPVQNTEDAARVWSLGVSRDSQLQPLVQPRRTRSPLSGQDSRKNLSRKKSMPRHFGIGAHRPNPQRRVSDCLPPSQPSRAHSPTGLPFRKRATEMQGPTQPRKDDPPSSATGFQQNLGRNKSMPTYLGKGSSRPDPHRRRDSDPPARPCRDCSPTDVCRTRATDKMATEAVSMEPLQMPLRKSSPVSTIRKSSHGLPPPPPPAVLGSPHMTPPAQPRRNRSPPLESQKTTLRRCA